MQEFLSMNQATLRNTVFFILSVLFLTSCEEDFDIVTEYKDQTVIYAFLEHKDPWYSSRDTNWIVVNKAFLGEANVNDMASVSDSVNYSNYDEVEVSLQRINSIDPNSSKIGDPIILDYTTHYKDSGAFATDNNIVFYTTEALMQFQDVNRDPRPNEDESYFYKLSVKKPNKEEVYATLKMIRGIYEGRPMTTQPPYRSIQMSSFYPNYTFTVEFGSNRDARVYNFRIRSFYYEKRTDGNIYIDYVDYEHALLVTSKKIQEDSQEMEVNVSPLAYYSTFDRKLADTSGVVWRAIKIETSSERPETHALLFTLSSQETYVYNQITQPSDGIVQDKPTYSNITNGLGLFTSKWNFQRNQFAITSGTIDSLSTGVASKDLKFLDYASTAELFPTLDHSTVIKRY